MVGTSLHAEHPREQTAFLCVLRLIHLLLRVDAGDHSSVESLDAAGSVPFAGGSFRSIERET